MEKTWDIREKEIREETIQKVLNYFEPTEFDKMNTPLGYETSADILERIQAVIKYGHENGYIWDGVIYTDRRWF